MIVRWAEYGGHRDATNLKSTLKNISDNSHNSSSTHNDDDVKYDIKEYILKLFGKNLNYLEFGFSFKIGDTGSEGSYNYSRSVNYESFLKSLKYGGIKDENIKLARGLFLALGGGTGFANINLVS